MIPVNIVDSLRGAMTVYITFTHHPGFRPAEAKRRYTRCKIKDVSGRTLLEGTAICHPKDNFNKATGRKVALTHALASAKISKRGRRVFWEAYFREFPLHKPTELSRLKKKVRQVDYESTRGRQVWKGVKDRFILVPEDEWNELLGML